MYTRPTIAYTPRPSHACMRACKRCRGGGCPAKQNPKLVTGYRILHCLTASSMSRGSARQRLQRSLRSVCLQARLALIPGLPKCAQQLLFHGLVGQSQLARMLPRVARACLPRRGYGNMPITGCTCRVCVYVGSMGAT